MGTKTISVAMGDTLWGIAKRNLGAGHRWPEIYAANRDIIKDPNLIRIGQRLTIPDGNRYGASDPHPLQRSRPQVAPLSGGATHGAPLSLPQSGSGSAVAATTVNAPAIKFDLAVVPPVRHEYGEFSVTLSWAGQVIIWQDATQPLATVSNKGLELSTKRSASTILGDLIESKKLTIGYDHRVTYEDLMGTVAYGAPGTTISSGVVLSTAASGPVYRTQIKRRVMQGKLRGYLFVAHDMTINFDIEVHPKPPTNGLSPQPVAAPAPYSGRVASDVVLNRSPIQKVGEWTVAHKGEIAAAVLLVGAVVLAVATLGAAVPFETAAAATTIVGATALATRAAAQRPTNSPGA